MKRKYVISGAVAALAVASLVGCSTASTGDTGKGSEQPSNVVVAVGALPDSLTPQPWGGSASHVVLTGLGSQLLSYDLGSSDDAWCESPSTELVPRLATSAAPNEDGTGIIVELSDLTSQWGNELSAEDVKWSLEIGMVRQPVMQGTLRNNGFDVDNIVTIIDEKTVQLNTTKITSSTLEALQNNLIYIHDSTEAKKHVTADDPTANNWLSRNLADYSGWQLEEFTPGTSLTLTADPDWPGERGAVERVVVRAVPNTATRSQLVQSGEAHVANGFEYSQYENLSNVDGVTVMNCTSANRDTMMFNTTAGPLADPKVRHAISKAIDRETLVDGAYAGYGVAAGSIFPMVEGSEIYKFDPEAAKKLLADAGYPDGFSMTLSYSVTRPGPVAEQSALLIQSMLGEVGIDVELLNVASATDFSTALIDGRYEAVLYAEPLVIADPAFYAYAFYGSGAPSNSTGWGDPAYDDLLTELRGTPHEQAEERQAILEKMVEKVDAGAPILSLVEARNMVAKADSLSGAIPLTNGQVYFNQLGR